MEKRSSVTVAARANATPSRAQPTNHRQQNTAAEPPKNPRFVSPASGAQEPAVKGSNRAWLKCVLGVGRGRGFCRRCRTVARRPVERHRHREARAAGAHPRRDRRRRRRRHPAVVDVVDAAAAARLDLDRDGEVGRVGQRQPDRGGVAGGAGVAEGRVEQRRRRRGVAAVSDHVPQLRAVQLRGDVPGRKVQRPADRRRRRR